MRHFDDVLIAQARGWFLCPRGEGDERDEKYCEGTKELHATSEVVGIKADDCGRLYNANAKRVSIAIEELAGLFELRKSIEQLLVFDGALGQGRFDSADHVRGSLTAKGFVGEARFFGFDIFCQPLRLLFQACDFNILVDRFAKGNTQVELRRRAQGRALCIEVPCRRLQRG